ncbi:hypothetical protein GCM10010363_60290 [Streptomyces omiyaensis]|uniref:hypothetical protein n=1 Tax=Streptomyces omiyaensis TaxID=68247 RepID=UPI00167754B0|nr:hypothetical protein [Streptomyces omiyaensis]GGY71093.1 hypothetical protein GCM10010363_60290 [Streptomyces omiyaensis]
MDFTQLTCIPVDGTDVTLRPVYDPVLRSFSVHIRQGDVIYPLGLDGGFTYADEPLAAIDEALAEVGVRELTGEEAVFLYAGLVHAKGGPDWHIFRQQVTDGDIV